MSFNIPCRRNCHVIIFDDLFERLRESQSESGNGDLSGEGEIKSAKGRILKLYHKYAKLQSLYCIIHEGDGPGDRTFVKFNWNLKEPPGSDMVEPFINELVAGLAHPRF